LLEGLDTVFEFFLFRVVGEVDEAITVKIPRFSDSLLRDFHMIRSLFADAGSDISLTYAGIDKRV